MRSRGLTERPDLSHLWRTLGQGVSVMVLAGSAFAAELPEPGDSVTAAGSIDAVLALWRCNVPGCDYEDWTGAVINWPSWAAYHTNARSGYNSRSVFSPEGEPLFPYMGEWADGCEVTVEEGTVLIIEWQRGTDEWRETYLQPDDTYVIDLVPPEDGAMIEGPDGSPGFRVSLANCEPQPVLSGLTVSKTNGQTTATPGTPVVYTITVSNTGTEPVSAVTLTDALPAALVLPVFTPASGTYDTVTGAWTGIDVAPGDSISMTLAAAIHPAATGTLVNTVTVSPSPPVAGLTHSDSDTDVLVPVADLAVVNAGPAQVTPGASVSYTITVTNNGPSDASGVVVDDVAPAELSFVSNAGDCTSAFPCALGVVPAGTTRTIAATFSIPVGFAGPYPVENSASVSSNTADPDQSDNQATVLSSLAGLGFYTIVPCRVIDTREPASGPALAPGAARTISVAGTCNVPLTAKAVSLNIIAVQPTTAGNLRAYASGLQTPLVSTVNYAAGQTRANNAVVTLGPDGALEVLCSQASGSVHVIVDVSGYFE